MVESSTETRGLPIHMQLTQSNIQITLWHTQSDRGLLLVAGEDIGTFAENGFIYEAGRKKDGFGGVAAAGY